LRFDVEGKALKTPTWLLSSYIPRPKSVIIRFFFEKKLICFGFGYVFTKVKINLTNKIFEKLQPKTSKTNNLKNKDFYY